jgi:hypothetical protein
MSTTAAVNRTAEGRFAPGISGNPKGRPRGSRSFSSVIEEAMRDGEAEALIRIAIALALGGDKPLVRFFAQRIWPAMRGRLIDLGLPEGTEYDPRSYIAALLRGVGDGRLTPEEAALLGRVVKLGEGLGNGKAPVSDLYSAAETPRTGKADHPRARQGRQEKRLDGLFGDIGARDGGKKPLDPAAELADLPAWLRPQAKPTRGALFSTCSPTALAA